MKSIFLSFTLLVFLFACRSSGSGKGGPDTTYGPSDTTGLHVNPALRDPNSNPSDTMKVVDSVTVRDSSIKDKTNMKHKGSKY